MGPTIKPEETAGECRNSSKNSQLTCLFCYKKPFIIGKCYHYTKIHGNKITQNWDTLNHYLRYSKKRLDNSITAHTVITAHLATCNSRDFTCSLASLVRARCAKILRRVLFFRLFHGVPVFFFGVFKPTVSFFFHKNGPNWPTSQKREFGVDLIADFDPFWNPGWTPRKRETSERLWKSLCHLQHGSISITDYLQFIVLDVNRITTY